ELLASASRLPEHNRVPQGLNSLPRVTDEGVDLLPATRPVVDALSQVGAPGQVEDRPVLWRQSLQQPMSRTVLWKDVVRREGCPHAGKRQQHVSLVAFRVLEQNGQGLDDREAKIADRYGIEQFPGRR